MRVTCTDFLGEETAMSTKKEIVRAKNLEYLIETEFKGDVKAFAEHVDFEVGTIQKFLNPTSTRPCNDRAARKIESKMAMRDFALDSPLQQQKEVYYVEVYTNGKYTYETVSALREEKYVHECSAVLGDFDIFLKIEVEHYHLLDMLLARIARFPGVKRTKTFITLGALRWHRKQEENLNIPQKNKYLYFSNGIEEFVFNKVNHHLNSIKELERGEIVIKDTDSVKIETSKLIYGVEHSILATRHHTDKVDGLKKYLEQERKELVKNKEIICRRLMLLDDNFKKDWQVIKDDYKLFANTGSTIRFILKEHLVKTPLSSLNWENFIVIDEKFVCIRMEEQKRLLIKQETGMVEMYVNTFNANWEKSISFNSVEEILHKQK